MIAKKKDIQQLSEKMKSETRVNTAPGVRMTRTTRGTFARPVAKSGQGTGDQLVWL